MMRKSAEVRQFSMKGTEPSASFVNFYSVSILSVPFDPFDPFDLLRSLRSPSICLSPSIPSPFDPGNLTPGLRHGAPNPSK